MKKCIVVIFLAFTLGSTSLYADDTFGNAWNSLAKEGTQTSLFFYWDPALSAIGAAGNIQLIYPYHLEFIVASYDGYLGLGLDLLQFVWMVGGVIISADVLVFAAPRSCLAEYLMKEKPILA
jgi:hypothetical protein